MTSAGKTEKLAVLPLFPIPTNTLSHIHTHKHAHTHTLAFSNAWQVLQAKPDLGPDLLLEGSRKQCHDPGVRPEVKV